jgi:hypothetical protein
MFFKVFDLLKYKQIQGCAETEYLTNQIFKQPLKDNNDLW